ncbi:MAG: threonine/serine dehydratase [Gemmatimonadota bacterium]|nr:threonine/serine dehydratase [Gemmatimonadota bacterium]
MVVEPISMRDIVEAQLRIKNAAIRTPLVRLNMDDAAAEIYLKLENLQPIGSFKIRGAANAMRKVDRGDLEQGVWTASAGNMAQGVAWCARQFGVPCTVVVPDDAPEAKLAAMQRLGASFVKVPFTEWYQVVETHIFEGMKGVFVHPVSDPAVIAGNGTIGLEILDDLPDVDTIVMPFGGGGLSCGVASAVRSRKPETKLYACELDIASPLKAAFEAGEPVRIENTRSFVDGMGSPAVLPEMWDLVYQLLDGSLITTAKETASALKLMAERNHIISEGAGAAPVATALAGKAGTGKVVCIISGGNIDTEKVIKIIKGNVP